MAAPPDRHVDTIPPDWPWIASEVQPPGEWNDYSDDRPLDTEPLMDALSEGRTAAKERARDGR